MKNLKKVLAVVLAFAMIIGTNVFAASFPDLDMTANYAEAVSVLADLGILEGYEDGTIQPEGDITRAEFAAIVCRIKGLENAANSAKGTTQFTDVAADSWASGYINMASQQGIINGVGGGLFLPDENVKFEEAVKMVVAALGYTPRANTMGSYPTGYLAVASQIGVTNGVSGAAGEIANRGTVARLAYNALDVPLMEQVSYGTGSIQYAPGDSILLDSLDLIKVEATIDAIPGSTGNSNDLQPDEVRLTIKRHYIPYDGKLMISDPTASNTYSDLSWYTDKVNVGTTNAQDFLNKTVIAYLQGAYDDDVVIKAIVEKTGKNTEVTFRSEDLYSRYTDMSKNVPEVAYYDDAESSSSYNRVTVDPTEFTLYVNDIEFKQGEGNIRAILPTGLIESGNALGTFANLVENALGDTSSYANEVGFNVTLLDNDTDSEYDVAYVEYYTDMVVDMVNANTYRVTAKNSASARSLYLDPTERNASFTIENQDGSEATFEDIQPDMVLSIRKGIVEDDRLITGKVIIVNNNVTGNITEISDSDHEITVGDTTYKVEINNDMSFENLRTNTEATFYVNARGNIFYMDKSAIVNNMKVGFATKIGSDGGMMGTRSIQMMNEEGEFVLYDLANKVTINEAASSVNSDSAHFETYSVLAFEGGTDSDEDGLPDRKIADKGGIYVVNAPVAYDLNSDGEVYKLIFTPEKGRTLSADGYGLTAYAVNGGTYNINTEGVGGVYLTDNSLLFSIDPSAGKRDSEGNPISLTSKWNEITNLDEGDISVMKKDALIDGQVVNAYALNCDDDSQAKALVGYELVNALVANSNLMVVTGVSSTTNADGDNVRKLTGLVNGEEIEVYVSDDTDKAAASGAGDAGSFAKGDVVVYQSGAGNELKAIAKIFSASAQFSGDSVINPTNISLTDSIVDLEKDGGEPLDPAVDGTDVQYYFGYARNLRSSNLTLVINDSINTDGTPAATEMVEVSFKNANFTVYDRFEGRDPRIAVSDLGEVEFDREISGDAAGDFVFVRVVDDVAQDALIIKTK